MRVICGILLICVMFLTQGFGDEVFRKRGESSANTAPKTTKTTNQSAESSDLKKREDSKQKSDSQKNDSQKATAPKIIPESSAQTKRDTQKTTKSTNQSKQSTQKPIQSQKSTKKTDESKKPSKKKPLGYRNIAIQNIKKQQKIGVDFFIGLQFGIDIVSMQDIQQIDRDTQTRKSTTASASFGLKGGIVSEESWVGGRFYAELSYLKIPKFNVLNIGVDLDLLVKYYEAPSWKIGGFIGAGGGMNTAFLADKSLDSAGTKSLISVGWVNVGLLRFVYYHSTGIHGIELNAKIVYVTPTIYSLKNKNTGITTAYKASSSTIMASYTYQF